MNDHNEHDDSQCEHLHVEVDYQVRTYTVSKGSADFKTWYEGVFSKSNPYLAPAFEFKNETSPDGEKVLEVLCHDPVVGIDALETMFYAYRYSQSNAEVKPKLVSVNKPGMN